MNIVDLLEADLGSGQVKQNEPLSRYTTFKIGGPARYFFVAHTTDQVAIAVKAANKLKLPVYVLGGGSNVLISDAGFPGLLIRNEANSIKITKRIGKIVGGTLQTREALVEVDTGVLINRLVRFTCDEGLAGLERHLGLPGTVGGALYMNSKWTKPPTYVGDVLYEAKVVNQAGEIRLVNQVYFKFGYDRSVLQQTHETVLTATFLLKTADKKQLWETAEASMQYRRETQPMGVATAGCTFRNIPQADALRLATPNLTKSAGFLVDQAGLKGYRIGNAQFSTNHANFIINNGGATAGEVKQLIDEATRRVKEKFGVQLETEIVLLGKFN